MNFYAKKIIFAYFEEADFLYEAPNLHYDIPAGIFLFKVNNKDTIKWQKKSPSRHLPARS